MTWGDVDFQAGVIRLKAENTKDREARAVPMCSELREYIEAQPRALHRNHVFTYRGEPVKDIRTVLRRAAGKAGIPFGRNVPGGFVFHDTRHSFVTHARKAGVAEAVIMAATGHSTRQMFDRYNKIDTDDLVAAAGLLESSWKSVDQNVDHGQTRE